MLVRLFPFRPLAAAAFVAVTAACARAELIKVSPFLPPQNAASATTPNAPLEYSGSLDVDNVEQYRIVDPAKKVGVWLKLGERDPNLDVVVKRHDRDQDTVTVEHGGQTMVLPIHTGKVVSSGPVPTMFGGGPVMPQMPNVSPAIINTVVPNPTPADEERRLQAVAAEVARRRALREQAAQQQALQAGQPAPAPNPPNATRQDLQQLQQNYRYRR